MEKMEHYCFAMINAEDIREVFAETDMQGAFGCCTSSKRIGFAG